MRHHIVSIDQSVNFRSAGAEERGCNNRRRSDTRSQMLPIDDPPEQEPDIYRGRFESCFREHHARLLAFTMRRISGREAAEEVAADCFAVAWRRRDRIPDSPLPWLYAIANNVLADQYRSTRRRRDLDLRLAHEARADGAGGASAGALAPRR